MDETMVSTAAPNATGRSPSLDVQYLTNDYFAMELQVENFSQCFNHEEIDEILVKKDVIVFGKAWNVWFDLFDSRNGKQYLILHLELNDHLEYGHPARKSNVEVQISCFSNVVLDSGKLKMYEGYFSPKSLLSTQAGAFQ
jgi:hypothetical protein